MDAAVPILSTQALLLWTLLGFLVIWMLLFAVLAFRLEPKKQGEESIPVPARDSQAPHTPPIAVAPTAPAMLHMITAQPVVAQIAAATYDSSDDVGTTALL